MTRLITPTPWDGKPITKPGLVASVPMDSYHGADLCDGPSISSTGLRTIFGDSPAHYWIGSPLNPDRVEKEDTAAFRLGKAAHHLFSGEAGFREHFAIRPEEYQDYRGAAARIWKDSVIASGKIPLTPEDMIDLQGMAGLLPWQKGMEDSGLANNAMVRSGVLNGEIECSLVWKDEKTGVWLKARPDAIPTDGTIMADMKTAQQVDEASVQRSLGSFRYDMQAALARMGMRAVLGIEIDLFAFVWVQKTPPYSVSITTVPPEDMDEAEHDLRVAIDTFARCLASKSWPGPTGYRSDAAPLGLSMWDRQRANARRDRLKTELLEPVT
jgi:hypothetical protein